MRKIVSTLMLLVFCLAGTSSFAETKDLVKNGDFSLGSQDWDLWAFISSSVDVNDGTLNWSGWGNSTLVGATQMLNVDVSGYDSLICKFDVMVRNQDRWSPPTYPAKFKLSYVDENGWERVFGRGFYYSGSGENTTDFPYTFIPQNTWYSDYYGEPYTTSNLFELTNKPKFLTKIEIYGGGEVFQGSADNVQLLVTKPDVVPEPCTMLLFGLGGLGMAFMKRKRKA